ncbi:hypothetical protein SAMD00019534_119060 [Acytostelium subglobosum LB1]|uniref:hypothetical protein n=1 Tax=Acytostelium subglobosum LB1 TaxID=1410327 RepID=UPI00064505B0|nr:hypothetical protein SAMD00019534_119060 [Acytostelium subglobosum LB1]GAM28730.1 hypothetical protein SAMD00019534_119060 [Acytostelium subglobosum LB1]|eukprot:XP_012748285.1 hypothetical protein SAMD00019534_119060 [Acytostelium subglobosum LB1]
MKRLTIGLLKCDKFIPEIKNKFGDIDVQFVNLLKLNKLGVSVDLSVFEVTESKFPKWDDVMSNRYNGFIISGSRSSVNDDNEWIPVLKDHIKLFEANNIKTVGVCFGHQAVASALGGTVDTNPKGWQVSDHDYVINPSVLRSYGLGLSQQQQDQDNNNQMISDIICLNKQIVTKKPQELLCYGGNEMCNNHGMINRTFLTLQGHPEYTPALIKEVLLTRKGVIPDDVIADGIKRAEQSKVNQEWFSNLIVSWFLQQQKQ